MARVDRAAARGTQDRVHPVTGEASGGAPAAVADATPAGQAEADRKSADKKTALREQAMADAGVQAMLEVFPAEIRDIEEL